MQSAKSFKFYKLSEFFWLLLYYKLFLMQNYCQQYFDKSQSLMIANILDGIVSTELISKINSYIYRPLGDNFINNKIDQIRRDPNAFSIHQWKMLNRDSKNRSTCFRYGSFGWFLSSCLSTHPHQYQGWGPLLEEFCIEEIKNNKYLITSHCYEITYGFAQCYNLFTEFLQTSITYNCHSTMQQILAQNMFNIFKYAYSLGHLDDQLVHLQFRPFVTSKTVETVSIIVDINNKRMLKQEFFSKHYSNNKKINEQFRNFFNILYGNIDSCMRDYVMLERRVNKQLYLAQDYPKVKQTYTKILSLFQQKLQTPSSCPFLLPYLQKNLLSPPIPIPELLKITTFYPNICEYVLEQNNIFSLFKSRKMKIIKILWANQKLRQRIAQMRVNGKNVLETVAESFGLCFNVIGVLWESGLFQKLPQVIRNVKSRRIVYERYKQYYQKFQQ